MLANSEVCAISYTKGMRFRFLDNDNQIDAHFSSFAGNEKIFFNQELVSEKQTYSKHTVHDFHRLGDDYKLEWQIENLLSEVFHCTLYKNGTLVKCYEVSLAPDSSKLSKVQILLLVILAGAIIIASNDLMEFSFWQIMSVVGVSSSVLAWQRRKRWVCDVKN